MDKPELTERDKEFRSYIIGELVSIKATLVFLLSLEKTRLIEEKGLSQDEVERGVEKDLDQLHKKFLAEARHLFE